MESCCYLEQDFAEGCLVLQICPSRQVPGADPYLQDRQFLAACNTLNPVCHCYNVINVT